jgi:putative transposase
LCRLLGASPSGFYASLKRPKSKRAQDDEKLLKRIREIHLGSRNSYGAPRILAELRDEGIRVGKKRVQRLMKAAGLVGATRRRFVITTRRDESSAPAPDLVKRKFFATEPNQLWVADITYIPTWAGFLYLSVVLDVFRHDLSHRYNRRGYQRCIELC